MEAHINDMTLGLYWPMDTQMGVMISLANSCHVHIQRKNNIGVITDLCRGDHCSFSLVNVSQQGLTLILSSVRKGRVIIRISVFFSIRFWVMK